MILVRNNLRGAKCQGKIEKKNAYVTENIVEILLTEGVM